MVLFAAVPWSPERSKEVLDKATTVRLAPDLSGLRAGERRAVVKLIEAGRIFHDVYLRQMHPEADRARRMVQTSKREDLARLFDLFLGPIATTLDNKREPFLPVSPETKGKGQYPATVTKEDIGDDGALLHPRTVVRRATPDNLRADLATLRKYPALDTLHPGLRARLTSPPKGLYAVPYAVAYADEMVKAHRLLNEAADAVDQEDAEFARYLRNRARDLLSNDYESGDASWITGRFQNLNVQIGSYETYGDALLGVKTFYAFSLLLTRRDETERLRSALKGLQAIEDSLPYDRRKRVREDIPVGVYDIIADFGQARGGNTATILPNEPYLVRRYGRIILLRSNMMRHPETFQRSKTTFEAAVAPEHHAELTMDGAFYRVLWHEIGHYLGVELTRTGQDLGVALTDAADLLEEMKADLVSLYAAEALRKQNYYIDAQLRSVYASGILRVLQNNRPRRDQAYQTMQLMQWNWLLENGVLSFDAASGKLRINHANYREAVGKMLARVLEIQSAGDKNAAEQFIAAYTKWDDKLHGVVAANIRAQQRYRYTFYEFAALGE